MSKHLGDNTWSWQCPCGHDNESDYDLESSPHCTGCDTYTEWGEVLSSEDLVLANDIALREQEETVALAEQDRRDYWEVQGRRCSLPIRRREVVFN